MKSRIIIIALIILGSAAIILNSYNIQNSSPTSEAKFEEVILDQVEQHISQGYTHSPGALPLALQLEELREKMESGEYRFARGQALGETSIAAKHQAFNQAREQLLKANSSSNIETILQCSLEKEQGVEVFLILGVKK
jgi:hypothetical protein